MDDGNRPILESRVSKYMAYQIYTGYRARKGVERMMESLILAQNERWRRVLSMQVGRDRAACRP